MTLKVPHTRGTQLFTGAIRQLRVHLAHACELEYFIYVRFADPATRQNRNAPPRLCNQRAQLLTALGAYPLR